MASPSFQKHRAWYEKLAALVGLCAVMALMLASFESVWFFFLEPLEDAWPEFEWCLLRAFVAVVALFSVLLVSGRWLPQRRLLRWPALILIVAAAAAAGWLAEDGLTWLLSDEPISDGERPYMVHTMVVLALLAGVLREYRSASLVASAVLHEAELNRIRLQSELTAGRLLVLQAQIEPHFLFNSLANLRRLLRTDAQSGQAMLADLMRYLESALPRMREDSSTLEREAELIQAFLAVHRVRMGARLTVQIDVPPGLGTHVVPPMMLLTLIENALKHGLGPLPEGGSITVEARQVGGRLLMRVADTGRGLVPGSGAGTGLANIRSRLKAMYGTAASLSLRHNQPHGLVAEIDLPGHSA